MTFLMCFGALYIYIKWKFNYWKRRGLPHSKPNFPLGISEGYTSIPIHIADLVKNEYDYFKSQGHKHFGIYLGTRPIYIPIDLELIKNIMIKDFSYFYGRGIYFNERDDPLNVNVVTLQGQRWKDRKEQIRPLFSPSKTRRMFEIFLNCSKKLITTVDVLSKYDNALDMKEIISCHTTDVAASSIIGVDCNSFDNDETDFKKHARVFYSPLTTLAKLKWVIAVCNAKLARFLRISLISSNTVNFFYRVVKDIVEFREKTNLHRPDLIDLLIDLKNNKNEDSCAPNTEDNKRNLTMTELTAECYMFFNAGIQSTATTIIFCLYEISKNLDIQEKLRHEINDIIDQENGVFTYDNINKMKYLHQVVEETIRMYPSLYFTSRQCLKDYKVPNTNITIENGTIVFLPIYPLHRDAEYFPEPEKFDPERFNETNKPEIRPFTYLPFGDGPRYCIAARFGEMQIKVGIATLLRNFRFTPNKNSLKLELEPELPLSAVKDHAWFNVEKI